MVPASQVNAPLARNAMAYVLAGGRGSRLMELTDIRAKPAVYFGGKSRIIDFALSNALNSGIRRIDVATAGVLALAVVSTAFTGQAIATGFERRYGVIKRLGSSPLPRSGLLLGKVGALLLVEALQVLVLSVVALVLGWQPHASLLPPLLRLRLQQPVLLVLPRISPPNTAPSLPPTGCASTSRCWPRTSTRAAKPGRKARRWLPITSASTLPAWACAGRCRAAPTRTSKPLS